MRFPDAFRALVVPALRKRAAGAAFCLLRERWDWSEAHSFVWQLARQRGAMHLPDSALDGLDDWIGSQILERLVEFETNPAAVTAFLQERVA